MDIKHVMVFKIKTGRGVSDPKIGIPLQISSPMVLVPHTPSESLLLPVPVPPPIVEETSPTEILPLGWSDVEQSIRTIVPPSSVVMGGSTTLLGNESKNANLPLPVALPAPAVSLDHLLSEMVLSVDDYDIICGKLDDPDWEALFIQLFPDEFGSIIAHVSPANFITSICEGFISFCQLMNNGIPAPHFAIFSLR